MTITLKTHTDHPYYCNTENYFDANAAETFDTVTDFLDEYEAADVDMNLCFRFDIHREDQGVLRAEFFLMKQRKGIFSPVTCDRYDPTTEEARLLAYLAKHHNKMKDLWAPFTTVPA